MNLVQNILSGPKFPFLGLISSYLNEKSAKYSVCQFSPSCTAEAIDYEASRLGMGLIEAVPLEIVGHGTILAVLPSCLTPDVTELGKILAPQKVVFPELADVCLPMIPSAAAIPPLAALFEMECFVSPLVYQQERIGFFAESKKTLFTMDGSEFFRLVSRTGDINLPTKLKYRAYSSERGS